MEQRTSSPSKSAQLLMDPLSPWLNKLNDHFLVIIILFFIKMIEFYSPVDHSSEVGPNAHEFIFLYIIYEGKDTA
jgi:hypothetical protein